MPLDWVIATTTKKRKKKSKATEYANLGLEGNERSYDNAEDQSILTYKYMENQTSL